jgi:hypothetical protein
MDGAQRMQSLPNQLAPLTPPAPLGLRGIGSCGALLRRPHAEEIFTMSKSTRARSIKRRSAPKNRSKASARKRAAPRYGTRAKSKQARPLAAF